MEKVIKEQDWDFDLGPHYFDKETGKWNYDYDEEYKKNARIL